MDRRDGYYCYCLVTKSCLTLRTPWTVARQAPLSMGFPRQEYLNGLPFPSPGDLPDPEIKPVSLTSPALQVDSLPLKPPGKPSKQWWHMPVTQNGSMRVSPGVLVGTTEKETVSVAIQSQWDVNLELLGALSSSRERTSPPSPG